MRITNWSGKRVTSAFTALGNLLISTLTELFLLCFIFMFGGMVWSNLCHREKLTESEMVQSSDR